MHQVIIDGKKYSYKSCYQGSLKKAKEMAKANGHLKYLGASFEVIEQGVYLKTSSRFYYFA